jgi:hypothetical protein
MNWHRIFGLILYDFFSNSPYHVELEIDLSKKEQLLDLVLVRKASGVFQGHLPDGMENLVDHNLITFKSLQETLDAWTVKELIGHYVNYRKQYSPTMKELLPEEQFRLFGICARFPEQLSKQIALTKIQDGVYDCLWGTDTVRLLVIRDLPQNERNAMLQLFSAVDDQRSYAQMHYQQKSQETSSLIQDLLNLYREEGLAMPYTMEDYKKEVKQRVLKELTLEERLEGVSTQEVVKALPTEEVVKALSPEDVVKSLPPEERVKGLLPEDLLQNLTEEEIEAYLTKLKTRRDGGEAK